MGDVVVVATFRGREGREQDIVDASGPIVERAHTEPGCLAYAFHRSADDPRTMALIERWASSEALAAHLAGPAVREPGERGSELLAGAPQSLFLGPLPLGDPSKGRL